MVGRNPGNLRPVKPIRDGVIADFDAAEKMLTHFIRKTNQQVGGWARPRVVIGVPAHITQVERRAVQGQRLSREGQRSVSRGRADGGRSRCRPADHRRGWQHDHRRRWWHDRHRGDFAGGVVISRSVRVAGDAFDQAIIHHMKKRHEVLVGERTAEEIKVQIGSATALDKPTTMEVKGRHMGRGVPVRVTISDGEVREAIGEPLKTIVKVVRETLDQIPPELSADIYDRGIALCGGSALLRNLDRLIHNETQLPVQIVEQPLSAVVLGAGKMLADKDLLRRLAIN